MYALIDNNSNNNNNINSINTQKKKLLNEQNEVSRVANRICCQLNTLYVIGLIILQVEKRNLTTKCIHSIMHSV